MACVEGGLCTDTFESLNYRARGWNGQRESALETTLSLFVFILFLACCAGGVWVACTRYQLKQ